MTMPQFYSMNPLQHHRLALPLVGPALGGPALHHGLLRTYPCQTAIPSISPEAKLTSALAQCAPLLHHPQIIMFSDLECDYINPIDLCNKLNQVRPPPSTLGSSDFDADHSSRFATLRYSLSFPRWRRMRCSRSSSCSAGSGWHSSSTHRSSHSMSTRS